MKYVIASGNSFVHIKTERDELSLDEIKIITKRAEELRSNEVNVRLDGDYLDCEFERSPQPFERIRRITGYLVGTTDRWNNAKREELNDRVKHGFDITDDDFFD